MFSTLSKIEIMILAIFNLLSANTLNLTEFGNKLKFCCLHKLLFWKYRKFCCLVKEFLTHNVFKSIFPPIICKFINCELDIHSSRLKFYPGSNQIK